MPRSTRQKDTDPHRERQISREALLKAGVAVGAGAIALASPLGARGIALARESRSLARQPLRADQITLRFMTRAGTGYRAYFRAAGEAFSKMHPNVSFNYETQATSANWTTKLKVEIAGGDAPDIVFSADDDMTSFAARGAWVDLLPFFKASGLRMAEYWPAAINPQFLGAHLFAMPLDYAVHVMYYNKQLFDRQHLRYPTDQWTWSDFVQAGRHLTIDRSGKRASEAGFQPDHVRQYAEDGGLPYYFTPVLRSNGGEWANQDLTRATLDTPAAIATFQWIADLGNTHFVSPSPRYATSLNFGMDQGNVAMHFDGTWNFGNYAVSPLTGWQSGNIDIVPFPRGSRGRSVGAEASGLCIPAGGKAQNVKWAWEFIKFMTTDPGQRLGFKRGIASIPNSRALATELVPTYRLPHNSRIILELLPQATLPFWCQAISDTELEDVLVNAPYPNAPELEDLYKGRATAAQAMPRVNRRVQALLTADQGLARTFGTKLHL